jgi:hypothetical protein
VWSVECGLWRRREAEAEAEAERSGDVSAADVSVSQLRVFGGGWGPSKS